MGVGTGGNGNNQWEWERNGNKTRLNVGLGMGMETNRWEWERMGLEKIFPLISSRDDSCSVVSIKTRLCLDVGQAGRRRLLCRLRNSRGLRTDP